MDEFAAGPRKVDLGDLGFHPAGFFSREMHLNPPFKRSSARERAFCIAFMWVWVKIKPPGYGPQILVHVSTYQGKPFWGYPIFDPQPCPGRPQAMTT